MPGPYRSKAQLFTWSIDGARELENALMQLPLAMAKSVLRKAAVKAMQPVADAATLKANIGPLQDRRGAKKSAGYYKASFIVSTQLTKNQAKQARREGYGESSKSVNVYAGSKDPKAHLEEFGTRERVQKKTGRRTGAAKAFPVLRPAWEENKNKVFDIFFKEIQTELLKAARRLAKKAIKGTLSEKERKALMK